MHGLGAVVDQPVVQALVVAVVEPLLLERVLEVPVRLRHEDEVAVIRLDRRDRGGPVLVRRAGAGSLAPRPLEDVVQHQHRHVAANTVALVGDPAERGDHRRPQLDREGVQLHDVGPRGEVGIPAVRQDAVSDAHERAGIALHVVVAPEDEVLRVRRRPRMIGRDVVRHEVEDQFQAATLERLSRRCEATVATELAGNLVLADAVRRADDVGACEVGQRTLEALHEPLVSKRDLDAGRASFPDPHQPDRIEPELRDRVPLLDRHVGEADAQLAQPDPGVDLVDERMRDEWHGAREATSARAASASPATDDRSSFVRTAL